jgi:hypothetical protein
LFNFAAHILVLSFISFFHLLLGHPLSAIEDWFYRNGWEILILGKFFAIAAFSKFRVRSWSSLKKWVELELRLSKLDGRILVISLMFWGVCFAFDQATLKSQNVKYLEFHFLSFIGLFVLFGADFTLLGHQLLKTNDNSMAMKLLSISVVSILFTVFNQILIPYHFELIFWYFSHMAFLLVSHYILRLSWVSLLMFTLIFIAPLSALSSLNFLWGSDYSIVVFGTKLTASLFLPFQVLALGYFYWTQHQSKSAIDTSIDYKSD